MFCCLTLFRNSARITVMPRRAQFIFEAIYELDSATLLTLLQLELLTGGRALQTRDEESDTPLHAAIMAYDKAATPDWLECIRMLLAAGADPNARDDEGVSPLHRLVITQSRSEQCADVLAAMQMLLEAGADVELADKDGWSPLISAACYNGAYLVPALLRAGADVNVCDSLGRTALSHAAGDSAAVVGMLVSSGADPNARDAWGHTPLYYAEQACDCSRFCHPESVVQALLAAGGICSAPHHSVNNSP